MELGTTLIPHIEALECPSCRNKTIVPSSYIMIRPTKRISTAKALCLNRQDTLWACLTIPNNGASTSTWFLTTLWSVRSFNEQKPKRQWTPFYPNVNGYESTCDPRLCPLQPPAKAFHHKRRRKSSRNYWDGQKNMYLLYKFKRLWYKSPIFLPLIRSARKRIVRKQPIV